MQIRWNQNGNWLLTASRDHLLKLFDIRAMKELQTFRGHKREATGKNGLNFENLMWFEFSIQIGVYTICEADERGINQNMRGINQNMRGIN